MQFYDVIKRRESVKSFKNTPIDDTKLTRMIDAVLMSPSWKNNSSYKFILVDDPIERDSLSQAIVNDTPEAAHAVMQAPMVAVVVADPSQSGVIKDKEFYLVDSAIAMEHFVLAATNEGYGTCWIASLEEDIIRQTLNIPNDYRVVAMTPIGEIGTDQVYNHEQDNKDNVFMNSWGNEYYNNHTGGLS